MKLAVYANCQAASYGASLRALLPASTVEQFNINNATELPDPSDYDLLFVQPKLAERFGVLADSRVRLLPTIIFTGFQPDCTYIFHDGKQVASLVGGLHSSLIAACFVSGVPAERVPSWFSLPVFRTLGYLAEFDRAKTFLLNSGRAAGIDLTAAFDPWMRRGRAFMHTINHPAVYVAYDICRLALMREGLEGNDDGDLPQDALAGFWWPVYRCVADALGVAEQPLFRKGGETASLAEFTVACYRTYAELPRQVIMQSPSVARVLRAMERARLRRPVAAQ